MTGYFKPLWNFKFEKSSIGWWLKSNKKKVIDEHVLILDWWNLKYFIGQLSKLNFFVPCKLYGRKFLRIVEIENFQKRK